MHPTLKFASKGLPEDCVRHCLYFALNKTPASPCDSLKLMEKAPDQSVFIGKPCDASGLRLAHNTNTQLVQKTALAIGFFCAGTPSTQGTLELLKSHRIDPTSITDFRYRGIGWPGMATAHFKDRAEERRAMSNELEEENSEQKAVRQK